MPESAHAAPLSTVAPKTAADLNATHATLTTQFGVLSGKLKRAAVALSSGEPPAEVGTIASELEAVRVNFYTLRAATLEEARYYQLAAHMSPDSEPPRTLADIEQILHAIAEARERREQADRGRLKLCVPLETALEIRHSEQSDFAPLSQLQQQATDLRRRIAQSTWPNTDMDALTRETEPFATLLSLVRVPGDFDDAQWDTMQATVESAFGRALAVALVRGRLTLGQPAKSSSASPPPPPASNKSSIAPTKATWLGAGLDKEESAANTQSSDRKTILPEILPYLSVR